MTLQTDKNRRVTFRRIQYHANRGRLHPAVCVHYRNRAVIARYHSDLQIWRFQEIRTRSHIQSLLCGLRLWQDWVLQENWSVWKSCVLLGQWHVEYKYYVLTNDFGVDIPHQRSFKSKAFGAERNENNMRYQIVQFRKSYQYLVWVVCFTQETALWLFPQLLHSVSKLTHSPILAPPSLHVVATHPRLVHVTLRGGWQLSLLHRGYRSRWRGNTECYEMWPIDFDLHFAVMIRVT